MTTLGHNTTSDGPDKSTVYIENDSIQTTESDTLNALTLRRSNYRDTCARAHDDAYLDVCARAHAR